MAEPIEDEQEQTLQQKSSVKVKRNSRGYNWEVKVYDDNAEAAMKETFRLEEACEKKYGTKPVEAGKASYAG